MSRQILEITLHLPDGQELTGRGRNVPATMERIYNQALTPTPRRHVRFMEPLESGPRRYYGTYNVQFGYRSGHDPTLDGVVEAKVAAQVSSITESEGNRLSTDAPSLDMDSTGADKRI